MTPGAARFAAVILAAGASSRMGSAKALLDAGGGESFVDRLAGVFLAAGCAVYVVLGEDAGPIARASRRSAEVTFVLNPEPLRGQLSSLQCGLRAAAPGSDAIFFSPVDAPGISRETILVLMDFLVGMDFAIPIYEGQRGHPVLIKSACAAEFLNPPEGASARDILHAHRASTRFVEVADPGILEDLDDPAAYERWRNSAATGAFSVTGAPLPHGHGSDPESDPNSVPKLDRKGVVTKITTKRVQRAGPVPGEHSR